MEINKLLQDALTAYQVGELAKSEEGCRQILGIQPDNAEALHLLGLIFYKRKDYALAAKSLRRSIKANPNDADVYYDLGNVLHDKGQVSSAITSYKKAVKLNPEYVEAYNNMGIALQDNKQLDRAIKCYKEALRIAPGYSEVYNNLGVAFQEKRDLAEAITCFQEALRLMPDYADAYSNLVDAVRGRGYESKNQDNDVTVYAIYRCLLGEDFIQESISSIDEFVDRIFVFWDDAPWDGVTACTYKGETVSFPKKFDDVVEKIRELNNPKIELIYDHRESPDNQLTHFVNDVILPNYGKPSIIVSLQVDHVFRGDEMKKAIEEFIEKDCVFATTNQVEVWKGLQHIVPERTNKVGAVFCNLSKLERMPSTLRHGGVLVMPKLSASVFKFGFAVSEKVMYWKHLLSIAGAGRYGGEVQSEDWYEEWLKWDSESDNGILEVKEPERTVVLKAIPYDKNELPEAIRKKFFE